MESLRDLKGRAVHLTARFCFALLSVIRSCLTLEEVFGIYKRTKQEHMG